MVQSKLSHMTTSTNKAKNSNIIQYILDLAIWLKDVDFFQ